MRATPLTVLSPIPWWWALWIRLTWPAADKGTWIKGPLLRLSFLTSFDGSDIQYIEAFVRVVPARIYGLYAGAKGFPGPSRFGPVARYIEDHSHEVDHFWVAHPEASTTMVSDALKLREAYAAADLDTDDPIRFGERWRRFLTDVQRWL
jgi:hypothetical protein